MSTQIEQGTGKRFDLTLAYDNRPIGTMHKHPAYREINPNDLPPAGQLLSPAEADLVESPVLHFEVKRLIIKDKMTPKTVDVLRELPRRWKAIAVAFPPTFLMLMRNLGQDISSPSEQWRLSVRIPLMVFSDERILTIPVYRVKRQEEGLDETAEQLTYNVGQAKALTKGLRTPMEVGAAGRHYLVDTFGKPLILDP